MEKKQTQFIMNSWYPPIPTDKNFKTYKKCGFDYFFLLGEYLDGVCGEKMEQALTLCDKYQIKAYIDISEKFDVMEKVIEMFQSHPSFVGINFDEPVIYNNTLTHKIGIVEMTPAVEKMHKKYPNIEFLQNLNPTTSTDYPWGTPKFTYEEYLEAQEKNINSIFKDSDVVNWLSCDDYPICYEPNEKKNFLKKTWLQNIEYLANVKKNSSMDLKTNFFIQSMPYAIPENLHDRVPSCEDLRLQINTLLAFGFDMISYFCYATPTCEEFAPHQQALITYSNKKTKLYGYAKKINFEIKKFSDVYSKFKTNWKGVCPIYGKNSLDDGLKLLKTPLSIKDIKWLKNVESNDNIIIGYMEYNESVLLAFVNVNETSYNLKPVVDIEFNSVNNVDIYNRGKKHNKVVKDNKLQLKLNNGEAKFVVFNK